MFNINNLRQMEKFKISSREVLTVEIDYSEINRNGITTEDVLSLCELPRKGWLRIKDDRGRGIMQLYTEEVHVHHYTED